MCIKCVRYSKRCPPKTITMAHAKVLAHRALKGQAWPLFRERAANIAVEAWIYRLEMAQSRKIKQRREI